MKITAIMLLAMLPLCYGQEEQIPEEQAVIAAPTNLSAATDASGKIKITWTDNSNNETSFKIERSLDGTTFKQVSSVAANSSWWTDIYAAAGTTYYYRVCAFNSTNGNSGYSNIDSATSSGATPTATPTPPAPSPTPSATPTVAPSPSPSPTATPSGGIASNYPGDEGIGSDPNVILADDFESYTDTTGFVAHGWSAAAITQFMAIDTTDPYAGKKSVRFRLPVSTAEQQTYLKKKPSGGADVCYARVYEKWAPDYNNTGLSNHNGVHFGGGTVTAGQPVNGTDGFAAIVQNVMSNGMAGETPPGYDHAYVYWPLMNTAYGDHWYPDGKVVPSPSRWLDNPGLYPGFKKMPLHKPDLGQWYCYETMLKLNTPGKNDGELKWWCDGVEIADFTQLTFRNIATLKIDEMRVQLHALTAPVPLTKWYDNVVIATQYIGPMKPKPTPSPSPTATPQTPTPTPTTTPTPTAIPSATPSPTASPTPPSPTPTASPSPSPTATPAVSLVTVTVYWDARQGDQYTVLYGKQSGTGYTQVDGGIAGQDGPMCVSVSGLEANTLYYFSDFVTRNGITGSKLSPVSYTTSSASNQKVLLTEPPKKKLKPKK